MNATCIIVLNYNNGPKTVQCISGIMKQTLPGYRIILIDNHSTDDSLGVIQEFLLRARLRFRFIEPPNGITGALPGPDEVLIVKSPRNGGYSCGNNIGIRLAASLSLFRYLLIINNDVVLKETFLEEMVKRYEHLSRSYGSTRIALGATELGEDGNVHHHGFHYIHLLTGIPLNLPVFPSFKYIVGSCIFTPIDAPLMDESFFLYFDDTRYSKILRSNGYILENSPGSSYIHSIGETVNMGLQGYLFSGLLRFYRLHYPILLPLVVPVRALLILYLFIKTQILQ
jgi:GT2 family glycosyltransferase